MILLTLCLVALASPRGAPAAAQDRGQEGAKPDGKPEVVKPFELIDGDRVVFVGGTFFEREGKLGYIETALTSRFPDRNVTFRNLGYAGDTVRCESRTVCEGWANFGPPEEGFERLKKLVAEIKPTVVFVAYGMGESFEGEQKLPQFVKDYDKLLDMLAEASGGKPRFVLIGPTYHENLGRPLPEPAEHNKQLKAYTDAISRIASERGARYVDLFDSVGVRPTPTRAPGAPAIQPFQPLTEDGIQLTPAGYLRAAEVIEASLGYSHAPYWEVEADAAKGTATVTGAKVTDARAGGGGLRFSATDQVLPLPTAGLPPILVAKSDVADAKARLRVTGLAPGRYTLKAGDAVVWTAAVENWANPVGAVVRPADAPDEAQAEKLRELIVAKNADYFNYWRHENDTYILGYRKHEQGRNAVEFPEFVKLAEAKDKEIAKLKVPQPVTYTLERVGEAGK